MKRRTEARLTLPQARLAGLQLGLGFLSLTDVHHHHQHVVHAVDFNRDARGQHRCSLPPAISQSAFPLSDWAGGPDVLPEPVALRRVFPETQLDRSVTNHLLAAAT